MKEALKQPEVWLLIVTGFMAVVVLHYVGFAEGHAAGYAQCMEVSYDWR